MRLMITLELHKGENSLEYVKKLEGIKGLEIDEDYGLVAISPKRNLYTIRASGDLDGEKLKSEQPKVKGVHGDMKVTAIKKGKEKS